MPGHRDHLRLASSSRRTTRATRLLAAIRGLWRSPAGRFLLRYPAVGALAFLLPAAVPSLGPWLIEATAHSLNVASVVMPTAVHLTGTLFSIGQADIVIVEDCTPLFPTLLLGSAILAFPASWQWKLAGIGLGAGLLWIYNMARIYLLMAVLRFWPAQFDLVHVYLWQTLTMLVVLGLFLVWARRVGAAGRST